MFTRWKTPVTREFSLVSVSVSVCLLGFGNEVRDEGKKSKGKSRAWRRGSTLTIVMRIMELAAPQGLSIVRSITSSEMVPPGLSDPDSFILEAGAGSVPH